jgi:predicted transcriptional regulator
MPPPDHDVTEAELAVLHALWDHGRCTIRDLADRLYPGRDDAGYATVQKLLERLERKAHVRRDRSTHAHVFQAVTDRAALVGHRLRKVAEELCGGMLTPLLTHLVRAQTLSRQERDDLRALIDRLDRENRNKS